MRALGYRGLQVLGLVTEAHLQGDRAPSYADIAAALGMCVNSVAHTVRRLERRGLLKRRDTGSRHRKGWNTPVIEMPVERRGTPLVARRCDFDGMA